MGARHSSNNSNNSNNGINRVPSTISTSESMPLHGIQFSFLLEWWASLGSKVVAMTTRQLCDEVVMPLTAARKLSFAEYLLGRAPAKKRRNNHELSVVKSQADRFVSHCWAFKFADVVKGLMRVIPPQERDSVYIWFDALVVNQHKRENVSQQWWSTVFRTNVQRIGKTILLLGEWGSPMVLSRAWCLWEILSSIEQNSSSNSNLLIAISEDEEDKFLFTLLTDYDSILKILSLIDAAKADAFVKADKEMIFEAIVASVGFQGVNQCVLSQLRKWLIETGTSSIERLQRTSSIEAMFHSKENGSTFKNRILEKLKQKELIGMLEPENEVALTRGVEALLANQLARLCAEQGDMPNAVKNQTITLEIDKTLFPEFSTQLGRDYNNLGFLALESSDYDAAERYLNLALDVRKKILDLAPPSLIMESRTAVARTLYNLASLEDKRGNFTKAETMIKEVIETMKSASAPKDHLAKVFSLYGTILASKGEGTGATTALEESLNLIKDSLGADHINYFIAQNSFARHLTDLGLYSRALVEFDSAISNSQRILGDRHPTTADIFSNRARCFAAMGSFEEALIDQAKALDTFTSVYGPRHESVAKSHNNVGFIDMQLSRPDEAIIHLKKALEIRKEVLHLDDKHILIATTMCNIAECESLIDKSSPEQPMKMIDEALVIVRNINPDHPFISKMLVIKAGILQKNGRYKEAEVLMDDAIESATKALGDEHPNLVDILACAGKNLAELEKLDKAESLLTRASELGSKLLAKEKLRLSELYNAQAVLRNAQNRPEEALEFQRKAYSEDIFYEPREGLSVARDLQNIGFLLGQLCMLQDRREEQVAMYEEAVQSTERALSIRTKILGSTSLAAARTLCNASDLYELWGDYEKAEAGYRKALDVMQNRGSSSRNLEHEVRVQIRIANLLLQRVVSSSVNKDPSSSVILSKEECQSLLNQAKDLLEVARVASEKTIGKESMQLGQILSLQGEVGWRLNSNDVSSVSQATTGLEMMLKIQGLTASSLLAESDGDTKINPSIAFALFRKCLINGTEDERRRALRLAERAQGASHPAVGLLRAQCI